MDYVLNTLPVICMTCVSQKSTYRMFYTCDQGGRVVKALDLSSNVYMHTWVQIPFLVALFLESKCKYVRDSLYPCLLKTLKLIVSVK